ncbi:MAG: 4Fe-4S dicluster domain-containing protein [Eggerthellaceae bacterium]|nr:4Fe-4S dicluster domain-containing protein [Eggerthellaceae bacterium]
MAIDVERCMGCNTCTVACKMANNLPNGIWWNRILTVGGDSVDTPAGQFPNNTMSYRPISCQHCSNPACVKVCPVGATWKDTETGIVRQDYDKCIGCRMCMAACPYTGVRSYNWETPKYYIDFAAGDYDAPVHQKHTVEKCTFCWHRLARNEEPACMQLCIARARHWGDLDDPESAVNKAMRGREVVTLLPEMGTKPNVFYLL